MKKALLLLQHFHPHYIPEDWIYFNLRSTTPSGIFRETELCNNTVTSSSKDRVSFECLHTEKDTGCLSATFVHEVHKWSKYILIKDYIIHPNYNKNAIHAAHVTLKKAVACQTLIAMGFVMVTDKGNNA